MNERERRKQFMTVLHDRKSSAEWWRTQTTQTVFSDRIVPVEYRFDGLQLQGVDLQGMCLRGLSLQGADLREAKLSMANLTRADLRGADLRGATCTSTDFRHADLRGIQFEGMFGPRLYLCGAQMDEAFQEHFRRRNGQMFCDEAIVTY